MAAMRRLPFLFVAAAFQPFLAAGSRTHYSHRYVSLNNSSLPDLEVEVEEDDTPAIASGNQSDTDAQQTQEEASQVSKKCQPLSQLRGGGNVSVSTAGANISDSEVALLGLGMSTLYECTPSQMRKFKNRFGLYGSGCFSNTNFHYKTPCANNNVVWLYPEEDPNNAFCINKNACHRLLGWSEIACSVQVQRVSSPAEATMFLKTLPRDSIRHLVLGGHGDGTIVALGEYDGVFTARRNRGIVPVGAQVSWPYTVKTYTGRSVAANTLGTVGGSRVGRLQTMYFSNLRKAVYVDDSLFTRYEKREPSPSKLLLQQMTRTMHRHSSLFLDSCLGAREDLSPNLAQYVSKMVGKGIRVIGVAVSFSQVNVRTFRAWHASINTWRTMSAERTFINADASCPSFARSRKPNRHGECECRSTCRTKAGKLCPRANATQSSKYFLPYCAESWVEDPCTCSKTSKSTVLQGLLVLILGALYLFRGVQPA